MNHHTNRKRYAVLDGLRGLSLLSMIAYHAVWDLVYIFGFNWQWYRSEAAYIWQQSICCSFILLSGFCLPLGKRTPKRGILVFLAGAAISAVTVILMPENQVIFGVLTLIGSCMLLLLALEPLFKRCRPLPAFTANMILFFLTKNMRLGYVGFPRLKLFSLPGSWYCNLLSTYFGFPVQGFYSTDYFPLFPWLFLFASGYFLFYIAENRNLLPALETGRSKPLEWLGRRSLAIYMVHQPVLYAVFSVVFGR